MSQINPFTGAMSLPPTRSVAARMRQSQALAKNLTEAEVEESALESPDAIVSINDEHPQHSPDQRQPKKEDKDQHPPDPDQPARLDVSA